MAPILVVNDDADLVKICELVLDEEAGHNVETLTRGRMAPEFAKRMQPELIILDWHMKDSTGEERVRRLRHDPATAPIPVLMISAIPNGSETARMYGLDADLKKPLGADDLLNAVDRLLRSGT